MATGQQLHQAYELIKGGYKEHAASLLAVWLVSDPCNADAWWLLAMAAPSRELMRHALGRLLELRPDDLRARQLVDSVDVRQIRADGRAASAGYSSAYFPTYPPAGLEPRLPSLRRKTKRANTYPHRRSTSFYIALLMSGLFGVFGCALLTLAVISGLQWGGHALEGLNPLLPALQIAQAGADSRPDLGDINLLGNVGFLQYRSAMMSAPDERHLYTFTGNSGDWVAIEVTTPDSALDPALALYSGSGLLVGGNADRAADDPDASLALALPQTGAFTIAVSAQGGQGAYTLSLKH